MKRRDMMRSLAFATALIPVSVPARPPARIENCRLQAMDLAQSMKGLFGGEWRVAIEPDFILISKRKP